MLEGGLMNPRWAHGGKAVIFCVINETHMEPGRSPDTPLSSQAKTALNKVNDTCRKRGIGLMLLDMPSAKAWSYEKHQAVAEFARENGIPFLDMNIEAKEGRFLFDWTTDTKDAGSHLNLSGAQKATAYLGAYLKTHYDLPDRHLDSSYAFWKDDIARYQELRAEKIAQEAQKTASKKPPSKQRGKARPSGSQAAGR